MGNSHEQSGVDIHALIQQRKYDFYGFIRDHRDAIDDHVLVCGICHNRMIGWSSHLPKLRVRATVNLPEVRGDAAHSLQLRQLKRGQCLPCGCEVTSTPWTKEEARAALYEALAVALKVSVGQAQKIPEGTGMRELPLATTPLRRLRDKFWIPDGSSGNPDVRDREEGDMVRQLPETIADFIKTILKIHAGTGWMVCTEHWSP